MGQDTTPRALARDSSADFAGFAIMFDDGDALVAVRADATAVAVESLPAGERRDFMRRYRAKLASLQVA